MIIYGVDVHEHDFTNSVIVQLDLSGDMLNQVDDIERLCVEHGYTIDDYFASLLEEKLNSLG